MYYSFADRSYLHNRHRLSHQQIDYLLGENRSKEFLSDKLDNLETVKCLLNIYDLFAKHSISFTSIKGPLLSYKIYSDPAIRFSHDIDLLIDEKDIEKVIVVLTKNGYQMLKRSFWPTKKEQQEIFKQTVHDIGFYREESNSIVEVHWVLMNNLPITNNKQKAIITSNTEEMDFKGRRFTVLNRELELIYLLIHGSRHYWARLKWLVDIKEYPIKDIDEQKFVKLATQLDTWRIIGQANELLKKFYNKQLPFRRKTRIPKYFLKFAIDTICNGIPEINSFNSLINIFKYEWLMFPRFYYKWKLIANTLLRPNDILLINSSFKVIYYLFRPYSFIKRRILHV